MDKLLFSRSFILISFKPISMKRFFTLILFAMATMTAFAQFPLESPYPGVFRVNSPVAISGTYDVGRQTLWGDTITQSVCADLEWAYGSVEDSLGNVTLDSICCQPITQDLTGKIAVIRRGVCNFSYKAYNAQAAGAIGVIILNHYNNVADGPTTILNMSAGDSATAVTIPAAFITRDVSEQILSQLDADLAVNACFYVPTFANANAGYYAVVPEKETILLTDVGATYYNLTTEDVTFTAKCTVIDPSGASTDLTETFTVLPATDTVYTLSDNYEVTSGPGVYTFVQTVDNSTDTLTRTMTVSPKENAMFSMDNGVIDDWTQEDSASFYGAALRYDAGNFYLTGTSELKAIAATIAIHNIELFDAGDKFTVVLYDLDADGNGALPTGTAFDYNTNVTEISPIAYEEIVVSDTMNNDELLSVIFSEPVDLKDTSAYLLMVRYDGNESGTGLCPAYSVGGRAEFRTISSVIFTSNGDGTAAQLFTGGYTSNERYVARLHIEKPVGTQDIPALDANKLTVFPTPATDYLNVDLKLAGINQNVVIRLTGLDGVVANEFNLSNVQNGNYRFDVRDIPSGHYFLTVISNEGMRAQKVQVAH